jgi:type I restriction enzyme S subunit
MKFRGFVKLQRGFDLPKPRRKEGPYPIVGSTSIDGFHSEYKVQPPGVTTGRSGALGQVLYVNGPFWPLNTTLWVKDFKGNFPRYVYYFLQTMGLEKYNAGTGVPTLNRNHLDNIDISVHPLIEQRKVAFILSSYDDLIENSTRRIKILEEMAQATYREWFVNFRFPGHEKVKMVDSSLGKIPEGWEIKKFSEAVRISPTEKISKETKKPYVAMEGLSISSMLITPNEIRTGSNGSKFRNGDTLFARITPCLENGKTGFVQFLPTDNDVGLGSTEFIVFRARTVSPEYVYLLARQEDFRGLAIKSMSGASGRQRVDPRCFEKYYIAQPDSIFLESFSAIVRPIFRETYVLSRKNELLRGTRDLLLPKLISGEVDVSELDINGREMNS